MLAGIDVAVVSFLGAGLAFKLNKQFEIVNNVKIIKQAISKKRQSEKTIKISSTAINCDECKGILIVKSGDFKKNRKMFINRKNARGYRLKSGKVMKISLIDTSSTFSSPVAYEYGKFPMNRGC